MPLDTLKYYYQPYGSFLSYPVSVRFDSTRGVLYGTDSSKKMYIFKPRANGQIPGLYFEKECVRAACFEHFHAINLI